MPETPTTKRLPRLYGWILFTLLLLLIAWWLAPHRIPLAGWKAVLVTGGAVLGYWLDRALFPYARPHKFFSQARENPDLESKLQSRWAGGIAALRRAIIVFACIIGLTLGL